MRNKKFFIIFAILCSLTLIIVLSSVIFSVQHIYEHCENGDSSIIVSEDITLGEMVLSSHNFKKGQSIFLADKDSARESIEKNVPIINVKSIVKKFPNRIYINYEILFDYLQIAGEDSYYILSENCKITAIEPSPRDNDSIIPVYIGGDIGVPAAGEIVRSDIDGEIEVLAGLLNAFIGLGQEYYEVTKMIDFIDLRDDHQYVFIKTSAGVYFRLMGWNNIDLKLQAALSLYGYDNKYRYEGTITVSDSYIATHVQDVYYTLAPK